MDFVMLVQAIGDLPETLVLGLDRVGLIAGLLLLVVWAIRRARVPANTVPRATGQPTAKEILQAKYARGEISREQYQLMQQDIA